MMPPTELLLTFAVALLLLAVFDAAKRHLLLFALLVLPATLMHEGSHWLLGRLSGAQPVGFSVWPRRDGRRIVLGEVTIRRGNWFNRGLVGLAPLLLLPLAWFAVLLAPSAVSLVEQGAHAYLLASLVYGAIPSLSDWKLALRGLPGALLLLGAVGATGWLLLQRSVG
jgi:hypothetical protein